jgi:hypothetical protein
MSGGGDCHDTTSHAGRSTGSSHQPGIRAGQGASRGADPVRGRPERHRRLVAPFVRRRAVSVPAVTPARPGALVEIEAVAGVPERPARL